MKQLFILISLISSITSSNAVDCSVLSKTGVGYAFQELASFNFLKGFYEGYHYPKKVSSLETKKFIASVYEGCGDSGQTTIFSMANSVILLNSENHTPDEELFPEKTRDYGSLSCTSLATTLDFEGKQTSQILQYFNNGIMMGRFYKKGKKPSGEDFELYDKFFIQSCGYMDDARDIAQLSISEVLKIKKPKETKIIFSGEQTKNSNTEKPNSKNTSATSVPE